MLPILKEQLQQCKYRPLLEGEDLEVESLLSEKETYRSYLKYFVSLSSSQKPLCIFFLSSFNSSGNPSLNSTSSVILVLNS